MNYSLQFEPILSLTVLSLMAIIALIFLGFAFFKRRPSAWLRLLACAFFAIALLNPVIWQEARQSLSTIVAIVVDNSQSQNFGNRKADTEKALAELKEKLNKIPNIEPRIIQAAQQETTDSGDKALETRLFTPLKDNLSDVPPKRFGGAVFLTDGQIADTPTISNKESKGQLSSSLGFKAPVNALISGNKQEFDRKIKFLHAPRFGIAGKELNLSFTIQDAGNFPSSHQQATAELFINGKKQGSYQVTPGNEKKLTVKLPQTGNNIFELRTPDIDKEVTNINNHAATMVDGIRENLKVLLVSGEPHNGLRAWRDLLKSDTGVDLVHFTILRPPEKQDNTPLSQLSLIVFPTKELFVDKLKDFDLVIFDRYQHYDVLPLNYYEYMARYVENGGALLMATGPEFSGGASLDLTPLSRILPAHPTGNIFDKPFKPQLTDLGKRHPVVKNVNGNNSNNPSNWGPWLRQIEARKDEDSEVLMKGVNNQPLMLLANKGKGRVGMLLSDQGWLWERGFQGGGPYAALYRRMAHWLMKEPQLEEERLTAKAQGRKIFIERQTLQNIDSANANEQNNKTNGNEKHPQSNAQALNHFHIILPSGKTINIPVQKQNDSIYTAVFESPEPGLIHVEHGDKSTLVHVGAANMPEYEDVISAPSKLEPIATATGGHVLRLHNKAQDPIQIGNVNLTSPQSYDKINSNNLVFHKSQETRLISQNRIPLIANIWALLIGLALLVLVWWQEARE